MKEYVDYSPRAVVCSRGKMLGPPFDAEVMTFKGQYVVATGLQTREEAKAKAQRIVDQILMGYTAAIDVVVASEQLKVAKP